MAPKRPQAPPHLSEPTARWWRSVVTDFTQEPSHIALLTLAAESLDRCNAARSVIDTLGPVYVDRFGAPRARPEVAIERDSRLSVTRILRELALDGQDDARPPRTADYGSRR